jgi:hypothetical protein
MMAALCAIWRQPALQMRNRSTRGVSSMLIALSGLGWFALTWNAPHRDLLLAFCTGVPMGMLLTMWWIYLLGSAAAQCHPAALQLVPHLRGRVVRAVILAWVMIVVIETLLAGVPTGYPGQVALATGVVLIEVGIMASLWRCAAIGVALWLACFGNVQLTAWLVAFIQTPAALLAGAVVLALDGRAALRRLGRLGGTVPGHAVTANLPGSAVVPRAPAAGADRQPLFLRPLGRSWFGWHRRAIGMLLLACLLLRFWCAWRGFSAHLILAWAREIVAVAMLYALANAASREARRFDTSRTEQALLCLTPGAPDRAALNGVLARLFVAGFARSWALLASGTLVALAVAGAEPGELARFALAWLPALGLMAWPLRNYALRADVPRWPPVLFGAVMSAVCSAANNGGAALGDWLAGALALTAMALAVALWRWRAMLAAPPALPAGRLA